MIFFSRTEAVPGELVLPSKPTLYPFEAEDLKSVRSRRDREFIFIDNRALGGIRSGRDRSQIGLWRTHFPRRLDM